MEPEGSLSCSQEPSTGPYTEPDPYFEKIIVGLCDLRVCVSLSPSIYECLNQSLRNLVDYVLVPEPISMEHFIRPSH
jgi:hypothetical protein